jgi:ribonucleotide reductase alpha subunit
VLQREVDSAISKTLEVGAGTTPGEVARFFLRAHEWGLKGCTVYRRGSARGEVLRAPDADLFTACELPGCVEPPSRAGMESERRTR